MPRFDRFDIAEAYSIFAADYNEAGYATGRKPPGRHLGRDGGDIWCRLSRMHFRARPSLQSAEDLTCNGRAIYARLAARAEQEEP